MRKFNEKKNNFLCSMEFIKVAFRIQVSEYLFFHAFEVGYYAAYESKEIIL